MKEEQTIPASSMFEAYLVIFAVIGAQTGIGLAVFERFVYMNAKQDSVVAVILAGLYTHITMYIIIKTLQRYKDKDLYDIHRLIFGKWIGSVLNFIWIGYCSYAVLMVVVTYFEILSTYMFPEIPNWFVSMILIILAVYAIVGGIRVVMGVCFFSVFISLIIFFVLYQILPYFNVRNFLPMFETPPIQLLKAVYQMALSLAGFELIYFYYPYIQDKQRVQRYGQIGVFITNIFFICLMILAIGFFGGREIIKSVWPTLHMYKVVKYPFLEQYQVIVLCIFLVIILPIIALYLWSLTKGVKKHFPITQKKALYVTCGVLFVVSLLFKFRMQVDQAGLYFNKITFYVIFVYPYILFVFSFFIEKIKKRKKEKLTMKA